MIRSPLDRRWRVLLGLASVVLLLGAYSWLSYAQHLENPTDTTIPSWAQLWDGCKTMLTPNKRSGEIMLYVDVLATGKRLF